MSFAKRILAPVLITATLVFAGAACSGGGSSASFCDTLKSWQKDSKVLEGGDGEPGSKEFTAAMKKAKTLTADLSAKAPSEIKADTKVLADAVSTLADIDYTDTAALMAVSEKIDTEKIEKATKNIEKYAKSKCNIDLSES